MATTLSPIGQAVVTDPGTTGSSGYTLVAWSPAMSADDRAHLARVPQVSDYLHLENAPRIFFSFYRLPGGVWGFGKRFARGTRRGSYNRIVVYTLALPEDVMEALEWEPRLLPACRFRASGQEWSFQDLSVWEGEIPRTLPDLQVVLPSDGNARRLELLESRRRLLEESWGRNRLESALAQALGVLESGNSLLLPQNDEHEQLLAMVWSALPRKDRAAIPWTTHLAPGGLDLFRLANAPNPEEARANAGPSWLLLRDALQRPGSLAVAKVLATGTPPWPQVANTWYEMTDGKGLSLVRDGTQVKRWIAWVAQSGPPAGGFKSIRDYAAYLDTYAMDRSSLADPWASPVALLARSAETAANLKRSDPDTEASAAVYKELVKRELAGPLLTPQHFEELLAAGIGADTLEAALSLCLRPVHSEQDKAQFLSMALKVVRENETLTGRVAARHLVPVVAAAPGVAPLVVELIEPALRALQTTPDGLSEALRTWRDALYDQVVKELRRWLREAPKAALQAAGSWGGDVVKERRSILGLAEALASGGIPAERWIPFALAEAAILDEVGTAQEVQRFSDSALFPAGVKARAARQIAANLLWQHLRREDLKAGAAHRGLVLALASELAAQPEQSVAVLSSFSRLPDNELRAWGGPIAAVAGALHQRGRHADASAVSRNWLKQMAVIPWSGLPPQAVDLLGFLAEADRNAVTSVWLRKLSETTPSVETAAIFTRFGDQLRLLVEPKLRLELERSEISAGIRADRLTFVEGVERLLAVVPPQQRAKDLLALLVDTLPRQADKKLQVLFDLVLSPRLLPSARRLVHEKLFWPALRKADESLFWMLPTVAELAGRRGVLLLEVLHRTGELWKSDPATCHDRLKEAIKLGRLDAVAAFLHGTAAVQPSFLDVLTSKRGDGHLLAGLRRAAREPLAAWDLRVFLPRITGTTPPTEDSPR